MNQQTASGKLNRIAQMMRDINKPEYSNPLWMRKMKEYMEENMSILQNSINQPIEQLRKALQRMEYLSPFGQATAKAIKVAETQEYGETMEQI